MSKYFCDNLRLQKDALRIAYICKITNKICPKVRYSVTGEATPDVLFIKKGCGIIKKSEENKESQQIKQEVKQQEMVKEDTKTNTINIDKEISEKSQQQATNTPKTKKSNTKKKKTTNKPRTK